MADALPGDGSSCTSFDCFGSTSHQDVLLPSLLCVCAGLVLARAHSTGTPVLSAQQQQAAVTVLYQQLTHHGSTGSSSSSEPPVGSSSGSSSGRSVVLAGAAALALGYCGLVGVPLPGVESPTTPPPAAAAAAANGSGSSDTAGSNAEPPPLLRLLFGLAGSKDSRAVLRAVTAVGYIGAGSSREGFKLAAANGEGGHQTGGRPREGGLVNVSEHIHAPTICQYHCDVPVRPPPTHMCALYTTQHTRHPSAAAVCVCCLLCPPAPL